ncbi:MAG: radical SAM protein [Candidatus Paceibacterota bacterium]
MIGKILSLGRQRLWTFHREHLRAKHELFYLFWECTLNCNFRCKHCGSNAGDKVIQETLGTEDIKSAFLDVSKNFDVSKISVAITGGEPMLRGDLFEVMKYAKSLGFNWGMVSNGFLIDREAVLKAKDAGMKTVDISIDDIGEAHDDFRNKEGAYERAVEAVKLLKEADFLSKIRITTTIHGKNVDKLEEMQKTFSSFGIDGWRLLAVEPVGRTMESEDLLLSRSQLEGLLSFIKEKRKENRKFPVTFGCAHYLGDDFEDKVRDHFFYCGTGINIGGILHNGDIFGCPNIPRRKELIQGNVKKDSFSEVWNNKFEFFRDKNRTSCTKCQGCDSWNECLGGSLHSWDFDRKQPKVCFMDEEL